MKKIVIYSALVTALAVTGCSDFLDVRPVGTLLEQQLLTKEGIDKTIIATYARLIPNSLFDAPLTNYVYGDVMGGDANKGSNMSDQPPFTSLEVYTITIDNAYLSTKWARCYDGVFRSNTLINMCDKIKDKLTAVPSDDGKDYYTDAIADARFLRALWHFEAVKLFGAGVPYVSSEAYSSSVNPPVSNKDGSGYIYIWDAIIADLQYAYENLPANRKTTGQYGRANKWAAAALLGKVLVYQSSAYNGANGTKNRWAEAKTVLENVVNNGIDAKGTKYTLAATYETLYTAGKSDWTGESVFDIQTSIAGTQTNTNAINGAPHIGMTGALGSGGWGFYQPSNDLVNAHIVDANGLPLTDGSFRSRQPLTVAGSVSTRPVTDLDTYTDPRVDVSTGRFGTPYLDWSIPTTVDGWIREVTNGGYYLNKKNIPKKADKGSLSVNNNAASTAKNYHYIRFADVLLLYAEALIETGDLAGAREQINKVRARAANGYVQAADPTTMLPATSSYVLDDKVNGTTKTNAAGNYRIGLWPQFASKDAATTALRWERRIELAMEGHHWYDLARWGIASEELGKFLNYEKQYLTKYSASVYNSKWVMMPIPYNQILIMEGLLEQNEAWK